MTLKAGLLLLLAMKGNADKASSLKHGVVLETGGLVNDQYRLIFDLDGPFQIEETHHSQGERGKVKWSRVLTAEERKTAQAAMDEAWKAKEEFPKNPAAECYEHLTFINSKQTLSVRAQGGFPHDSAAGKLVARLHQLREAVSPPSHQ